MAVSVRELAADGRLNLRLRNDVSLEALGRPIRWIHPTALIDPQTFSEKDEAIITSGIMIPRLTRSNARKVEAESRRFVRNIAQGGVSALAFGTRLIHDDIPASLLDEASKRDLPVLEVPIETPFSWVADAIGTAAGAGAGTRLLQEYTNLANLMRAAEATDPMREICQSLAGALGAWVGVLSVRGEVVSQSDPTVVTKAPRAMALSTPAYDGIREARVGDDQVRLLPLATGDGVPLGTLAVGMRAAPDEYGESMIGFAVTLMGAIFQRRSGEDIKLRRIRSVVLQELFDGNTALAQELCRAAWDCPMPSGALQVVDVHGDAAAIARIEDGLEHIAGVSNAEDTWLFARLDGSLWAVTSAKVCRDMLRGMEGVEGLAVGVSRRCTWSTLATARKEAMYAADRAGATGGTVRFGESGQDGAGSVIDAIDMDAARALAATLDHGSPDLRRTVTIWLAKLCNAEQAARFLGIHRHTLAKRLDEAQTLLGRSLDDPQARAELWIALNATTE